MLCIHQVLSVTINHAANMSLIGDGQTNYLPHREFIGLRW